MTPRCPAARLAAVTVALATLLSLPADGRAQFTAPCEAACALTLGASSFVFAMGAMGAIGRLEGGYTTKTGPAITFAGAFLASAATGVALNGNGRRQRRVIYGSALGAAGGAAAALTAETLIGEHDVASRWAATLVGGAVGVVVGGVVGAATYDGGTGQRPTFTLVVPPIRVPSIR